MITPATTDQAVTDTASEKPALQFEDVDVESMSRSTGTRVNDILDSWGTPCSVRCNATSLVDAHSECYAADPDSEEERAAQTRMNRLARISIARAPNVAEALRICNLMSGNDIISWEALRKAAELVVAVEEGAEVFE
ncbi:MAG: hypothetical protein U9M92_00660 [Patescibacteria group bacterium]|nr:hypothetical protein [Patescibacteria group bacterium]